MSTKIGTLIKEKVLDNNKLTKRIGEWFTEKGVLKESEELEKTFFGKLYV